MSKEILVNKLALLTGKHVDVLNRYKPEVLEQMATETKPLVLEYSEISRLMDSIRKTNGASYRPSTGTLNPVDGYMVAIPGYEKKVNRVWNTLDLAQVVNSWLAEIGYTGDSPAFIGLWEYDGILYLDLSQWFVDRDKAIAMGKLRNQIAIWDCANKTEINTTTPKKVYEIDADIITDKLY